MSHLGDDYLISSTGRVWSARRYGGKLLNQNLTSDGYLKVSLGERKFYVHKLVAEAFLGHRPSGKTTVNHRDGDKKNNKYSNLEWASRREQAIHCSLLGLRNVKGVRNGRAHMTDSEVITIRSAFKEGASVPSLVATFGISKQTIWDICARRTWKHL